MAKELSLRFPHHEQYIVKYNGTETDSLIFVSPLTDEDYIDICWYLETYATHYMTEVDDNRARVIANKLSQWGEALFHSVFSDRAAQRLFNDFQDKKIQGRLLTIHASHPKILSLPWELLRDPTETYLFHANPRISIRRRLAGSGGERNSLKVKPKAKLHLLFVISRPDDAPLINPRNEATAILDALDRSTIGEVEVEFLRPATLDNLVTRLENRHKPPIDIIHFDGHGVFDEDGCLHEQARLSNPLGALKGGRGGATGYLLFENKNGQRALVAADTLGDMLNRQKVSLMVLSACQSATMGEQDAMGSIAARLIHAGIPSVLAMTHSILVNTTCQLFAAFYQHLVQGEGIGEALDNARRHLYLYPERGERPRGKERITLKLQDWFLPALYQGGKDIVLLRTPKISAQSSSKRTNFGNLPVLQEAGFWGRSKELWLIERAFLQGTRRLTLSGFGGQGKTYLALEAGRWLKRTGMFQKVCFVDYAHFQGIDAVSLAVTTLATVLEKNLVDMNAAHQALREVPTLLILDNLEAIRPEPLQELLEVAKQWSESEVESCRVLLTTRTPDFHHTDYPLRESLKHQSLRLHGLTEEDALAYFESIWGLPPKPQMNQPDRKALLHLFNKVDFHPLSLGLLARQLKERRPAELGEHLENLLAKTPNNPLLASLNLSLERLDEDIRLLLPRLGVFKGGAFEHVLLEVTEFSKVQWQKLRTVLEMTGLLHLERFPGVDVPYIKFHPTLTPILWPHLTVTEQMRLRFRYSSGYFKLSMHLHEEDFEFPDLTRILFQKELPNLLSVMYEVSNTFKEEWVVEFFYQIDKFLGFLGLHRDREVLAQRVQKMAGEKGSEAWYVVRLHVGEQCYSKRHYTEATQVFKEILTELGEHASYKHCVVLSWLGRCFKAQGQIDQAIHDYYQKALSVARRLEKTKSVERQIGVLHALLGDAFVRVDNYDEAKKHREKAFMISKEVRDQRQYLIVQKQLDSLNAFQSGNLQEMVKCYREAILQFRQLKEPGEEAAAWHNLGVVSQELGEWVNAEQAFREAARLRESLGELTHAADSWQQLAVIAQQEGRPEEAEEWYRKVLKIYKEASDERSVFSVLCDLSRLLEKQPTRLPEALKLLEEAVLVGQRLKSLQNSENV